MLPKRASKAEPLELFSGVIVEVEVVVDADIEEAATEELAAKEPWDSQTRE